MGHSLSDGMAARNFLGKDKAVPLEPSKVTTHAGLDIFVRDDGQFTALRGTETIKDKTLDGLRKKLDNIARQNVRRLASKVPILVLRLEESWRNENGEMTVVWDEGTFAGINAHTGELTIEMTDGSKSKKRIRRSGIRSHDATLLHAKHPKIREIRKAALALVEAHRAKTKAEKLLESLTEKYGAKWQHHYSMTTENAAALEEEIVTKLEASIK
jgi:nitrogenase molybdenum-iron protein alpha/beta subunit